MEGMAWYSWNRTKHHSGIVIVGIGGFGDKSQNHPGKFVIGHEAAKKSWLNWFVKISITMFYQANLNYVINKILDVHI